MLYQILADIIIIVHFLFILYVALGGLLVLKWNKTVFLHVPAAVWGALIMFMGWICPLTYVENDLRQLAGQEAYSEGFIAHYITPIIYPETLTRELQISVGIFVLALNAIVYAVVVRRRLRKTT
ncbi:MAG: DUF2784 domain-containing protein [Brumimicrobium sp.]